MKVVNEENEKCEFVKNELEKIKKYCDENNIALVAGFCDKDGGNGVGRYSGDDMRIIFIIESLRDNHRRRKDVSLMGKSLFAELFKE